MRAPYGSGRDTPDGITTAATGAGGNG
jgi:hypothetical protein